MFAISTFYNGAPRMGLLVARLLLLSVVVAWLEGCGGGGNSGTSQTPNPPDSTPNPPAQGTPDLRQQKLLSDTELGTPPIASAAGLTPPSADEQAWLQENHFPIRSIVYDADFSDLSFLSNELEGKRIVQLGESSHGSGEFSAVKVRIIKYLHESLGFNVIAMESSLSGCHIQDKALDTAAPPPRTGIACAFTVWDTEDLNELARYIRATRQTAQPLRLAGFDIQDSSGFDSSDTAMAWISPILDRIDPDLTNAARSAIIDTASDSRLLRACSRANQSTCPAFDGHAATSYQRLQETTQRLLALVEETPLDSPDRQEIVFAWLTVETLSGRLRNFRSFLQDAAAYAEIRDPLMAGNITRLAEFAYPNEKIIVWAHNLHISNHFPDPRGNQPMGSYLRAQWGDRLSSVGIFMLRGASALNGRSTLAVERPLQGSLESYAYSLRLGAMYLRIPRADAPGAGDDWLHRQIRFYNWGAYEERDVLAGSYDGLIIVDRSTLPPYN